MLQLITVVVMLILLVVVLKWATTKNNNNREKLLRAVLKGEVAPTKLISLQPERHFIIIYRSRKAEITSFHTHATNDLEAQFNFVSQTLNSITRVLKVIEFKP